MLSVDFTLAKEQMLSNSNRTELKNKPQTDTNAIKRAGTGQLHQSWVVVLLGVSLFCPKYRREKLWRHENTANSQAMK